MAFGEVGGAEGSAPRIAGTSLRRMSVSIGSAPSSTVAALSLLTGGRKVDSRRVEGFMVSGWAERGCRSRTSVMTEDKRSWAHEGLPAEAREALASELPASRVWSALLG